MSSLEDAFMDAARGLRLQRMVDLLDIGVNIEATDDDGWTALMFAAFFGTPNADEIADMLLTRGANVDTLNHLGQTALIIAAQHSSSAVLQVLLNAEADVESDDIYGKNALIYAACAAGGSYGCLDALLQAGANVDFVDLYGDTALMLAAQCGNLACLQLLIDNNADINVHNTTGKTALMFAANVSDAECVDALLQAGAEVDARDEMGWTPLMHAVVFETDQIEQCKRCIRLLLGTAYIDARDTSGSTALMKAAEWDCLIGVNLLLDAGANVFFGDFAGKTALMKAASDEIRVRLIEAGATSVGWEVVPLSPLKGLERLLSKFETDDDLHELFLRLEPAVKNMIILTLRALKGKIPDSTLRLQILGHVLNI